MWSIFKIVYFLILYSSTSESKLWYMRIAGFSMYSQVRYNENKETGISVHYNNVYDVIKCKEYCRILIN